MGGLCRPCPHLLWGWVTDSGHWLLALLPGPHNLHLARFGAAAITPPPPPHVEESDAREVI